MKSLDIVFLEEPLPEIKINKIEPIKADNSVKKAVTVKEKIPVIQKSTPQKSGTKTAWELALLAKQGKSGQGTSGSPGLKGTRGNPGDRPGMTASGGIIDKERITQTGGTGLKTDRVVPMSVLPAGNGNTIGAGGKLLVSDSEMVLEIVEWVRVAGQEQVQVKAVLARVGLVLADTALMPLEATPV
jgi:hypothetical protein